MDVPKKSLERNDYMVLKLDEIMEQVKGIIGENTDDASLKFLEDLSDTINDYEDKVKGDGEDWKKKFEDNDKEWRQKYQERFFSGGTDNSNNGETDDLIKPKDIEEETEDNSPKHFDELFSTE